MKKIQLIESIIIMIPLFTACHSMPIMQSAKVLDENVSMRGAGVQLCIENINMEQRVIDKTNTNFDVQFRWPINENYDWGLILNCTNLGGIHAGVDLKNCIYKNNDTFFSWDLFLNTGGFYISSDFNILFTREFEGFSITPLAGIGMHKGFGNFGSDNKDYLNTSIIGPYFNPVFAVFCNLGIVMSVQFETKELSADTYIQAKAEKKIIWMIGFDFLYRREITKYWSNWFYPRIFWSRYF